MYSRFVSYPATSFMVSAPNRASASQSMTVTSAPSRACLMWSRSALVAVAQPDGVVFLTDMLGGSPFRSACELADEQGDCEVLTGVNMQLAAEMMLERDGLSLDEFREVALACGKRGLTSLWHERRRVKCEDVQTDGI